MDRILASLPPKIALEIKNLPNQIKVTATEIRLRSGGQICVMCGNTPHFLVSATSQKDISDTVKMLCNSSVYAHTKELNSGYISLPYGHRAGVVGNFLGENLCDFSSLNIRIAHQIIGSAAFLNDKIRGGVLFAGPPASGKTTLLRDLIRLLSNNNYRVTVVDTRGEISAFSGGNIYNDLGPNTDVLFGIEKPKGIEIALRTMSPQYIAFDEIAEGKELERVFQSINGGAEILTTAHISGVSQLMQRFVTRSLIETEAVKTVVLLNNKREYKIIYGNDLINDSSS